MSFMKNIQKILSTKNNSNAEEEERCCAYCFHSERVNDSDACVCDINGIVKATGVCGRYKFDLFKVDPKPSGH